MGTNTIVPGCFGILYLEGGLLWVVGTCFLFGAAVRALFIAAMTTSSPGRIAPMLYAFVFANLPNVMQSGMYSILVSLVWACLPIAVIVVVTTVVAPSGNAVARPRRALA